MAIAIREIPVLTGQSAIDFVTEAEKWDKAPVPHLTAEDEEYVKKVQESGKNFIW